MKPTITTDHGCNPTFGCSVFSCNTALGLFACSYPHNCYKTNFSIPGGNSIIFRKEQVEKLHLGTKALTISPLTSLNAQPGANLSAGQLIGISVGLGVPLLVALLGALFVIWKQRKKIRSSGVLEMEKGEPQSQNDSPVETAIVVETRGREILESDPSAQKLEMDGTDVWVRHELRTQTSTPVPPEPFSWMPTPESTMMRPSESPELRTPESITLRSPESPVVSPESPMPWSPDSVIMKSAKWPTADG